MSQLLLATRNPAKLDELRRILAVKAPQLQVVGLDDVPPYEEVPETGATYAENALIKAREAKARTGLLTVAEDSGLAVDALNGMPGVLSARWAGKSRDDNANLRLVLEQLADTPDERLGATFICVAVLITPDGAETVVEGRMPGRLAREPRGHNGFGYDPIFVPEGLSVTGAELDPRDKDEISHRGKALRALVPHIVATVSQ